MSNTSLNCQQPKGGGCYPGLSVRTLTPSDCSMQGRACMPYLSRRISSLLDYCGLSAPLSPAAEKAPSKTQIAMVAVNARGDIGLT